MAKGGAAPAGGDAMAVDGAGPSGAHGAPQEAHAAETDLFTRLKLLQRHIEFLDIQEEYIKDEQKNLKRELLRAQEEVKRIQSVPLVIGQFLEMVDTNTGIVGSTTGSNYYVRILSTLNRELLKPSASVALHRHSNALVDVLPPEADSSISLMSAAEKPDVSYAVRASRRAAAAAPRAPGGRNVCPKNPWVVSRPLRAHAAARAPAAARRTLAAPTCRSRRSARLWSCLSRTTSCIGRLASTRRAACCCTARPAPAKPCWPRRWRTTPPPPSSASWAPSLCRNT